MFFFLRTGFIYCPTEHKAVQGTLGLKQIPTGRPIRVGVVAIDVVLAFTWRWRMEVIGLDYCIHLGHSVSDGNREVAENMSSRCLLAATAYRLRPVELRVVGAGVTCCRCRRSI